MTIAGPTVIALLPYLLVALVVGVVLFALFLRWAEYWQDERPWILGIKAAKRKHKTR